MAWRRQAVCRGEPVAIFYPDPEEKNPDYSLARMLCRACPVVTECLTYAMSGDQGKYGYWGGTTPNEREAIRRAHKLGDVLSLSGQISLDLDD